MKSPFFPFVLDQKPGFFLNWFLYSLFKKVQFDKNMTDMLRQMHRDGTVVYAAKYQSHLDYLLYHYCFRRNRLPYPKIAFDLNMSWFLPVSRIIKIVKFHFMYFLKYREWPSPFKTGFFKNAVQKGDTFLLFLVNPKGFYRHFIHAEKGHIQFLLETQMETDHPIYIVPQLILYKKAPEKEQSNLMDILFGYKDKPGLIRKISLFFRYNRRPFIDFGSPINLKAYLETQESERSLEEMAEEINQMLIKSIDVQKRVVLGPVMKSRQQIKELVLKDDEITGTIQEMAGGDPKKIRQLKKRAGEYFDEIAADFNITYLHMFHLALKWLWGRIFQGIDIKESEFAVIRESARKAPLVYVPSHKSHIDYLVLNDILYENQMHLPRIAAGRNLAFWPVGHLFRKSGAFFIRRSFKGARLYARIFARYIKVLLKEGDSIEFFIEGGRSRSGKLILPKTGFLSILVEGYREGYCDDLIFVPASITYDTILEQKSYLKEIEGAKKDQENFKQVLKARHFLKRKFGKIYIRFAQPISLKDYLADKNNISEDTHGNLALDLVRSINKVTLVTPLSVIATAILSRHRRRFRLHELISTVDTLLEFMKRYQIPIAHTLNNLTETAENVLSLLVTRKVIKLPENREVIDDIYSVDEENKRELEYYKNSIIHFFIPHAFVAVSLLTGPDEIKTKESVEKEYRFLRDVFKYEFVFDDSCEITELIDMVITYFLECSFISHSRTDDGFRITRSGFMKLPIWAGIVKTFLESYWIAARSIASGMDRPRKESELLKDMNTRGLEFHKLGLIDHIEAISHITFKNAMLYINKDVLRPYHRTPEKGMPQPLEPKESLTLFGQRLYELARFSG